MLGGSITQGHAFNDKNPDKPKFMTDAWGAGLKALLDSRFPCGGEGHTLRNEARSAAATDMHLDLVCAWAQNATSPLATADLVVVESSVNDVGNIGQTADTHLNNEERVLKYTELLIARTLRAYTPNNPALLYLGVSTRGVWRRRGDERSDAALTHLKVTRHYGIPHVSVMDALGPFATDSQEWWLENTFKDDRIGHPTRLGHDLAASLVMQQLLALILSLEHPMLPASVPPSPFALPAKLLAASEAELASYVDGRPLRIALVNMGKNGVDGQPTRLVAPAEARGWEVRADLPFKPLGRQRWGR